LDDGLPEAEAVAVTDGRIAAVEMRADAITFSSVRSMSLRRA
jgi:hypothetical protein